MIYEITIGSGRGYETSYFVNLNKVLCVEKQGATLKIHMQESSPLVIGCDTSMMAATYSRALVDKLNTLLGIERQAVTCRYQSETPNIPNKPRRNPPPPPPPPTKDCGPRDRYIAPE